MQNRFENTSIIATIKGLINIQFHSMPEKTLKSLVETLTIDEGTPRFISQLYNYCLALHCYGRPGPDSKFSRIAIFDLMDNMQNVTLTPDENDIVHFNSTYYPAVNIIQAAEMQKVLSILNKTAINHYLNPSFENTTFIDLEAQYATTWDIETYIPTGVFDSQEYERTIRKLHYVVQDRFAKDPELANLIFEEIVARKISLQQELEWKTSILQKSITDLENGAYDSWKPQAALETAKAEQVKPADINSLMPQVSSPLNLFMPINSSQLSAANQLQSSSATNGSSASVLFEMLAMVGVAGYLILRFRPLSSLLKNSWFSSTAPKKPSRSEYAAIENSSVTDSGNEEDNLLRPSITERRYT